MIDFGPHQYAPIHDHPLRGCLSTIVKGPGLYETYFYRTPENDNDCDQPLKSRKITNMTGIYSCKPSLNGPHGDGCSKKGFTKDCLTERNSINITAGKEQISFIQGYDMLHSVKNPHNKNTLILNHYFGDYHISWWLNRIESGRDLLQGTP